MGWSIATLENTLKLSKKCAKELLKYGIEQCTYEDGSEIRDVIDEKGIIIFYSDHLEHKDFLWDKAVQKILKKHKANGKVRFCDVEGDWRGTWWSYEFDGKGGLKTDKGKL